MPRTIAPEVYRTACRLPRAAVARLDRVAAERALAGVRVTRSDVLREALTRGLDLIDPPTPKDPTDGHEED